MKTLCGISLGHGVDMLLTCRAGKSGGRHTISAWALVRSEIPVCHVCTRSLWDLVDGCSSQGRAYITIYCTFEWNELAILCP